MNSLKEIIRNRAGFTLVEIMIALLILSLVITGYVGANVMAQKNGEDTLEYIGGVGQLAAATLRAALRRPFGWNDIVNQLEAIGLQSFSIVALTGIFSAMVMTVQFAVQMAEDHDRAAKDVLRSPVEMAEAVVAACHDRMGG